MAHQRSLLCLLIASLAVLLMSACGAGETNGGQPAPDDGGSSAALPQECTNPRDGLELRYPEGWHTNQGEQQPPCTWFHPEEFELPEAQDVIGIAIRVREEPVEFDPEPQGSPLEEVLSVESGEVDGRSAVRVESRLVEDGLMPAGTRTYTWQVEAEEGRSIIGATHDVGGLDYERNREVLDAMMGALRFIDEPRADSPAPVGEAGTQERATPDFPSLTPEQAILVDVRAAQHPAGDDHPAFDRVVIELDGPEEVNWRVRYIDPPVRQDGSGHVVEVDGEAFLELRLTPATGFTGEEDFEYPVDERIRIDGHLATEAVRVGDFEGQLAWVVGVGRRAPFAVAFFQDPLRLVVDVLDARG